MWSNGIAWSNGVQHAMILWSNALLHNIVVVVLHGVMVYVESWCSAVQWTEVIGSQYGVMV